MKFAHRLGYYLGGFAVGLIILAFFLSGKNASCDYGPNARTVKNIASKQLHYSEDTFKVITEKAIDSATVLNLIRYGNVNFSKSDTKSKGCKAYRIENTYKNQDVYMNIKNCDSTATIVNIVFE